MSQTESISAKFKSPNVTNASMGSMQAEYLEQRKYEAMEARLTYLMNIIFSCQAERGPIRLFDNDCRSMDKENEEEGSSSDCDETSSVELDEEFAPVKTCRHDRILLDNDPEDTGRADSGTTSNYQVNVRASDISSLSPQILSRVLDNNVRLKQKMQVIVQRWNQDNATGKDTIKKLYEDVMKYKTENQLLRETPNSTDDQKEKIKKLEEEKIIMHEQLKACKSDFDKEREDRTKAVKKLKDAFRQIEKQKEKMALKDKEIARQQEFIEALRAHNNQLKADQRSSRVHQQYPQQFQQYPVPPRMMSGFDQPMETSFGKVNLNPCVMVDGGAQNTEDSDKQTSDIRKSPIMQAKEAKSTKSNAVKETRPNPTGSESLSQEKYEETRDLSPKSSGDEFTDSDLKKPSRLSRDLTKRLSDEEC